MKLLPLSCLTVAMALSANAQTVYLIDFNTVANTGYPGGSSAWNIYAQPSNVNGSAISDSTGSSAAGITLSYSGKLTDSSNGNLISFDNATGGPSWVTNDGSLALNSAAADYFYTDTTTGSQSSFTIIFGNLTQGDVVDLNVWTSRASIDSGIGYYEFSLDGGSTWSGLSVLNKDGTLATGNGWGASVTTQDSPFYAQRDGNNNARYMNVGGLTITSDESLQIRGTDYTTNWVSVGAIQLTVVPEPATYALLFGLAVVGIAYRRRRR